MTKTIPLSRGKVAIVDDADYESLASFRWHAIFCTDRFYAARRVFRDGKDCALLMHRALLGEPDGHVDHVNGDGLDNRRTNLRLATRSQNMANRRMQRNNTSGFRGVNRRAKGWSATITKDHQTHCLGTFPTIEEAARARDRAATEFFGPFARLNFPPDIFFTTESTPSIENRSNGSEERVAD